MLNLWLIYFVLFSKLRGRPMPSTRGLPVRLGLAGLVIALAVLTTWSVAAGAISGGEHGIEHGDDDAAASSGRAGFARVNLPSEPPRNVTKT